MGPRAPGVEQVHDARGERLGLAGARAREHQHRAVKRFGGAALLGVQIVEIGRGPRGHGAGGEACALEGVGIVICAHGPQTSLPRARVKANVRDTFRARRPLDKPLKTRANGA